MLEQVDGGAILVGCPFQLPAKGALENTKSLATVRCLWE